MMLISGKDNIQMLGAESVSLYAVKIGVMLGTTSEGKIDPKDMQIMVGKPGTDIRQYDSRYCSWFHMVVQRHRTLSPEVLIAFHRQALHLKLLWRWSC
jgi:hypothetical protein